MPGVLYYQDVFAQMNSRFMRAIFEREMLLGHSASQAYVLVQFPKPSSSIVFTIFMTLSSFGPALGQKGKLGDLG